SASAFTGTIDISAASSGSNTLTIQNTSIPTFGALNAGSTVDYDASGAQTITAVNYGNLTLSTSGVKTFASGTTGIANAFTISGATANATANSTTINYNGSGAQTMAAIDYFNLTLSNAGTKAFGSGTTGI